MSGRPASTGGQQHKDLPVWDRYEAIPSSEVCVRVKCRRRLLFGQPINTGRSNIARRSSSVTASPRDNHANEWYFERPLVGFEAHEPRVIGAGSSGGCRHERVITSAAAAGRVVQHPTT